jgi:hypothetical protein
LDTPLSARFRNQEHNSLGSRFFHARLWVTLPSIDSMTVPQSLWNFETPPAL